MHSVRLWLWELKMLNSLKRIANVLSTWFQTGTERVSKDEAVVERLDFRNNVTSSDFIDYDGMGNQGRFPSPAKDKNR